MPFREAIDRRRDRAAADDETRSDRGGSLLNWGDGAEPGPLDGSLPPASPPPQEAPQQSAEDYISGLIDWEAEAAAMQQRNAAQAKADRLAPANDRFGHDLAWLDPQFQENPALLGTSARANVHADPRMVAAQNQALDQLFGIARDGGATAQERARRQGARAGEENWLRGQREADMADLAERGLSGSGQEVLALGADRQAAASRLSQQGLETDAWLEQRAQDAMMAGGELAGKMRDTGFAEGQARGTAADEFSALNQRAINDATAANKQFQQQAWNDMVRRRDDWDRRRLELGLDTAAGMADSDVRENAGGYDYAGSVAAGSAGQYNAAAGGYNDYLGAGNPQAAALQNAASESTAKELGQWGAFSDELAATAAGYPGAGGGAPTGGAPAGGAAAGGAQPAGANPGTGLDDDDPWGAGYA